MYLLCSYMHICKHTVNNKSCVRKVSWFTGFDPNVRRWYKNAFMVFAASVLKVLKKLNPLLKIFIRKTFDSSKIHENYKTFAKFLWPIEQ